MMMSLKKMINFAKKRNMNEDKGQILLYQTPDGDSRIEVRLQGETVWLNLDQMAELFQRNKSTISRHIKNVFEEGELRQEATVAKFATVVNRGIRGEVQDVSLHNWQKQRQMLIMTNSRSGRKMN